MDLGSLGEKSFPKPIYRVMSSFDAPI